MRGLLAVTTAMTLLGAASSAVAKPDLTVTSLGLVPPETGLVTATITNFGPDDVPEDEPFLVQVTLDGALCHEAIVEGLPVGVALELVAESCSNPSFGSVPVTVIADAEDDIDEEDESNNSVTATLAWAGADLVVSALQIAPVPTPVGEGTITATILNLGSVATDPAVDIAISVVLGGVACEGVVLTGGIAGGESVPVEISGCVAAEPGVHAVVVTVDTEDVIAEQDELNNAISQSFFWYAPDLVVQSLTLAPDLPTVGEGEITVTVANLGQVPAVGEVVVDLELDAEVCGTLTWPDGLPAGTSTSQTTQDCQPPGAGAFDVVATIDPADAYLEANEANNELEQSLSWYLPDLAVTSVVQTEAQATTSGPNTFVASVANQSPVPVAASIAVEVTVYLDDDVCQVVELEGGFAAGESREVTATTCTSDVPSLHVIRFEADSGGVVPETSEDNNEFDVEITFCGDGELCDGVDDDCDGQTDEDFPGLGGLCDGPDADLCAFGTLVCSQDKTETYCDETPGAGEFCNGADDDCDGDIDEDFEGLGEPCGTPSPLTECGEGIVACTLDGLETYCEFPPGLGEPEICDSLDNDCDAEIDEDFTELGVECTTELEGCHIPGLFVCKDGAPFCSGADAGFDEVCNGADDDCDGETDEAFPELGAACMSGQGLCRLASTWTCHEEGTAICEVDQAAPGVETCSDDEDNNCNGLVDENCPCQPGSFLHCSTPVGACQPGALICGQIGLYGITCQGGVEPTDEVCGDDADNNCDGAIDEYCPCPDEGATRPCDQEAGACADGVQVCAGGAWGPCLTETGYRPEECNGIDDDCDGITDESCPCEEGETRLCLVPPDACAEMWSVCTPELFWSACHPIPGTEDVDCINARRQPPGGTPDAGRAPDAPDAPADVDEPGPEVDATGAEDVGTTPPPKKGCATGPTERPEVPWVFALLLLGAALRRRYSRQAAMPSSMR